MGPDEEFDVLSFLEPTATNVVRQPEVLPSFISKSSSISSPASPDEVTVDAEELIIHLLDLPVLNSKPPGNVLFTLLSLMRPDLPTNFGPSSQTDTSIEEKLNERDVSPTEYHNTLKWLKSQGSTIANDSKMCLLSSQQIEGINQYLTSVISSPLSWIDDTSMKDKIWKESSLRLSQNCGRTAQPEFVRKITLTEGGGVDLPIVKLNEPSLTADNLGLKTWGSSLMLSRRLIDRKLELLKEPILELGAGTGLVGITCALLGCSSVMVTDLPEIVPNLARNIELNHLQDQVEVEILDWTKPQDFQLVKGSVKYETIILSDPIYSSQHPYWVVDMFKKFLVPNGTVLLQIPIRINFAQERDLLWRLMKEEFTEIEVLNEQGYDDFGEQNFIFKRYVKNVD